MTKRKGMTASTVSDTATLTVAEAAAHLGVSERTVWRYLKSGRLRGLTTGDPGSQRTLIDRACVDELRGGRDGTRDDARLAAALAECDALRLERDQLAARVAVLERAAASHRGRRVHDVLVIARALVGSVRARVPAVGPRSA